MEEIILEKRFGDIGKEWAGFKKAKACIIQAPYEGTVTYKKGASKGPEAIINASSNMELFDDELQTETYKIGIYTAEPINFAGDSPDKAVNKVKNTVSEVLAAGKFPVLLGGEHSLTIGAVSAFKEAFPNLSVLYLDAHYDLRDEYRGSKYNHACVARRIQEICPVVETGVRSLSKGEKDFLDTTPERVKIMSVYDILEAYNWKKEVSKMLSDTVYISIDLDVFDPSLMPSSGAPEPGGLGWYEFLDFLKLIAKEKKVVGFDVVELAPAESDVAPDFLAAKVVYRLLGYVFNTKR
ncbi:MAG: agmatinase [Candidatus Omnitrophica bacterium]|nr:agmatinase [Candidatus Omnitrophota bacterium]